MSNKELEHQATRNFRSKKAGSQNKVKVLPNPSSGRNCDMNKIYSPWARLGGDGAIN